MRKESRVMKFRSFGFILMLPVMAFVTGCAAGPTSAVSTGRTPSASVTPAPPQNALPSYTPDSTQATSPTIKVPEVILATPRLPQGSDLAGQVDLAKKDLAARLKVDLASIEVVEAVNVEWPDGSLGCPQPGIMYNQMVTPGSLIRLQYAGKIFEYHAGGSRTPFYCENPHNG